MAITAFTPGSCEMERKFARVYGMGEIFVSSNNKWSKNFDDRPHRNGPIFCTEKG